ncbi:MAG: catalase [Betaproteobacteria bacterium]|nr:catalase [Betaproteobacteria bacterium]
MATRKTASKKTSPKASSSTAPDVATSSAHATVGGPSHPGVTSDNAADMAGIKAAATEEAVAGMPFNANKPGEYGDAAREPEEGATVELPSETVAASTLSEGNESDKTGEGAESGVNHTIGSLDRVRVDSTGQALTTNQGVAVADNQNSLKAGLRGPTLLEDFILREKITHFDHERIPERIVHARGSAAHGIFQTYEPLTDITKASLFSEKGKVTPVFVRFSTVIGERGSTDTARDVRGFAVKFYTDEGNWDLVGNNIPVFFIQDAMKFPDLIHAAKPEPHHAVPQAATAHDTFWDFISLMPESAHMMMWAMSDRAIPRSYRMMQGFGVHTFRMVNAAGESVFVKFHWNPLQGTHSLVWDEAVKISGADPDFHRRDLWEAIEAGAYPEWELGIQVFTEEQADAFSFDVLDATKLIPEELIPLRPVGRLTLNRNPDNFFAETEQVAFCTAHIVPGLDFTNDPLLAGRIHSYVDTQISRLGGPNFHEIPINTPLAQVHNNQRDGMHRQAIARGRVAYEPNSLAGGCPFQAGMKTGFTSVPEFERGDKVRGKPEKFAEHYRQATLFFKSQTPVEQQHIINAFRFELTRVQVPAIRKRMLSILANVDNTLVAGVAAGLGMEVPEAAPAPDLALPEPELDDSPALSLFARPGEPNIKTRKVAILVADGVDGPSVAALHAGLLAEGAVPRLVGIQLGPVATADGKSLEVEVTLETTPSVLYDAVIVPGGKAAIEKLGSIGLAAEFVMLAFRHCKPILALAEGATLLQNAGVPLMLASGDPDPGIVHLEENNGAAALPAFIEAITAHRFFQRETDPPTV